MTVAECIHGMEFGCTICSGKDRQRQNRAGAEAVPSHPFAAKFDSQCPGCDLPIHAGERIVMHQGRAVHERCV